MAVLNTTRRGMLGAMAVAPIALAVPASGAVSSTWPKVRDAYLVANQAVEADAEAYEPIFTAWRAECKATKASTTDAALRSKYRIDAELDHANDLCQASHRALQAVTEYKVRNIQELNEKMQLLDTALGDGDDDCWRAILADVRRLAAGGMN